MWRGVNPLCRQITSTPSYTLQADFVSSDASTNQMDESRSGDNIIIYHITMCSKQFTSTEASVIIAIRFDSSSIRHVHSSLIRTRFDSNRCSYDVIRAWWATTTFENGKNWTCSFFLECSNRIELESNQIAIVTGFSNRIELELNRIELES